MPYFQKFFQERLLGKTLKVTRNKWVGIDFAHHNAFSDDTFPNLFAAFLGVYIYKLGGNHIPAEDIKPGAWWHFAKKNGFLTFYGVMDSDHGLSFGKNGIFDF